MRIYLGESDHLGHLPLFEAIVKKAREEGLAGATVLKGVLGYGASDHIRTSKLLDLSGDLPPQARTIWKLGDAPLEGTA